MKRFGVGGAIGVALMTAALAGPAAATVTFTADYLVRQRLDATINPSTGALQTTIVPGTDYSGSFSFTLGDISDVATAGPTAGTLTRDVSIELLFAPFNFAPDLQAQLEAGLPSTPAATTTTAGLLTFRRIEDVSGDPASYQYLAMSDLFTVNNGNPLAYSADDVRAYGSYGAIRGGDPFGGNTGYAPLLTGTSPEEIAAHLMAPFLSWSIGSFNNRFDTDFQNPVYSGHNYAGSVTFSNIIFVDSATGVVPEPATWAMMILGLGGAGVMLRRRAVRAA